MVSRSLILRGWSLILRGRLALAAHTGSGHREFVQNLLTPTFDAMLRLTKEKYCSYIVRHIHVHKLYTVLSDIFSFVIYKHRFARYIHRFVRHINRFVRHIYRLSDIYTVLSDTYTVLSDTLEFC